MTPAERRLRAQMGAYAMHSRNDPRETSKPGRDKFLQRFIDEVDPDRKLPEAERERRAEAARSAYFAGLALKSAVVRRSGSRTTKVRAGVPSPADVRPCGCAGRAGQHRKTCIRYRGYNLRKGSAADKTRLRLEGHVRDLLDRVEALESALLAHGISIPAARATHGSP